jgi:hypothetical protein
MAEMTPTQDFGMDSTPMPAVQPTSNEGAPGMSAAPEAQRPEPRKPTVVGDNVMANALSFFRDPDRLKLAAMAAAEAQRPDLLKWIQAGHEAQKENGIDALAALSVGDKVKALQLFNGAGEMKATSIEEGPSKGLHTIVFANGTRRDVNALQELKQFLTPPQRFADERANEVLEVRKEGQRLLDDSRRETRALTADRDRERADIARERLAQTGALAAANIELAGARAGLAVAQTHKADRSGGAKPPKPPTASEIRAAVESSLERTMDPKTGKETFDREEALQIKTRVEAITKKDPSIGVNDAVDQAKQAIADARAKAGVDIDKEIKDLKSGQKWHEFGDPVRKSKGMSEAEYRASETKARANKALALPKGNNNGAPAAAVADVPKVPFKEGDKIRGKDGRNYTVVNGLPQLDAIQPKGR